MTDFVEHGWTMDGVQKGYTALGTVKSYMLRTSPDLAHGCLQYR